MERFDLITYRKSHQSVIPYFQLKQIRHATLLLILEYMLSKSLEWENYLCIINCKLTRSLTFVCMNKGKPRSWAPTKVSSLGKINPTIPTLYSRQYLSNNSRFHLSICRYLLRFSKTITPYFPLSRLVNTGRDLPATSTLYLVNKQKFKELRKDDCLKIYIDVLYVYLRLQMYK